MKKVLVTVAALGLVAGAASAALAAGIEMEGSVRVRGLSEQQISSVVTATGLTAGSGPGGSGADKSPVTSYDQTVRIGMKAKPSDNLTGYILLETGDDSGDTYTQGNESTATLFKGGDKATNSIGILHAYIEYKPSAWGLKIGHMPVAPGTKQFINHDNSGDDAIYVTYDPNKDFHGHVAVVKLAENTTNDNSDDLDAYALVLTNKFSDDLKAGLNIVHLNGASTDETASASIFPGLEMTNWGVDVTYKIGKLTLMGDVNIQSGTYKETATASEEIDASGWAFQLGADYAIDKSTVGLLFAQGSGNDPDGATDDAKYGDAFINFIGDSAYQVYIPGYRKMVPGSFHAGRGLADGNNSGLSNLTLYQLKGNTSTTCPITGKPLAIRGSLSYMETTEDVINYTGHKEDEIGTEIDVVASWALTPNLTYMVEAAYLFTGDVYATAASGAGSDPENAYFLRHGITMKF